MYLALVNVKANKQATTVTGGRILNISIPDTATTSYTFPLTEPAGLDFLATMYDSNGWGTGGTTPVLSMSLIHEVFCADVQLSARLITTLASARRSPFFYLMLVADDDQ